MNPSSNETKPVEPVTDPELLEWKRWAEKWLGVSDEQAADIQDLKAK